MSKRAILAALHGHEKEEEFSIPLGAMRVSSEDNERTKLLKEVLRNSVKLHESAIKEPSVKKFQKAGTAVRGSLKMGRIGANQKGGQIDAKLAANPLYFSSMGLHDLTSSTGADDLCAGLAGSRESSEILRDSGRRIGGLCERLVALKPQTPRDHQLPRSGSEAGDVVAQPADGGSMLQSRVDKLLDGYLTEHLRFQELEDLSASVEKVEDYEGLRQLFPQRFKHHPNMVLLTSHALEDPVKFRQRIFAVAPKVRMTTTRTTFNFGNAQERRGSTRHTSGPSRRETWRQEPSSSMQPAGGQPRRWQSSPELIHTSGR